LALLAATSGEPTLATQLCVVAVDPKTDQSVRDELTNVATNRKKSIPSSQALYRHAIDQMQKSLAVYQKVRWMDEPDAFTVWQLSEDGRTVSEKAARLADLDWTRTVQFANAALQCGQFVDSSSGLAVAILAENAYRSSSDQSGTLPLSKVASNLPASIVDSRPKLGAMGNSDNRSQCCSRATFGSLQIRVWGCSLRRSPGIAQHSVSL
jgi:hypothetical protein